jgi:hypothetical protein
MIGCCCAPLSLSPRPAAVPHRHATFCCVGALFRQTRLVRMKCPRPDPNAQASVEVADLRFPVPAPYHPATDRPHHADCDVPISRKFTASVPELDYQSMLAPPSPSCSTRIGCSGVRSVLREGQPLPVHKTKGRIEHCTATSRIASHVRKK